MVLIKAVILKHINDSINEIQIKIFAFLSVMNFQKELVSLIYFINYNDVMIIHVVSEILNILL
jgi:hypothetical protein